MGKVVWTKAQDARLLKLWPHRSASEIARELEVTRNAVIGRYHRLRGDYFYYISPSRKESRAQVAERRAKAAAETKRLVAEMKCAISAGVPRDEAVVLAVRAGAAVRGVAIAIARHPTRIHQILSAPQDARSKDAAS